MRLLIDESAAEELEEPLRSHGIEARHVRSLDLIGADDPFVLALAQAEYGAVVTKDRYRKGDPREAALRKLVLNGSTGTITREMDIGDVAAEISRLGLQASFPGRACSVA